MTALSPTHWGLLVATPFMIATGQVLFKMTSEKLVSANAPFYSVFFNPIFALALTIYGLATLLWIYVLKTVPLAYAYSFMALTFIIVPLMANIWLGEALSLRYLAGATCIIIGLLIVQT